MTTTARDHPAPKLLVTVVKYDVSPGRRLARDFPRTEEARGSNPLTSTTQNPRQLEELPQPPRGSIWAIRSASTLRMGEYQITVVRRSVQLSHVQPFQLFARASHGLPCTRTRECFSSHPLLKRP
jgi:hypothetical protein